MEIWLDIFTTMTGGHSFWNVCHQDDDAWLTILVAFGDCESGAGFLHPELGRGHRVRAGDIFIVNPAHLHCTSEMGMGGERRRMVAIFVKSDVVVGAAAAAAVREVHGLNSHKKRRRGTHGRRKAAEAKAPPTTAAEATEAAEVVAAPEEAAEAVEAAAALEEAAEAEA